MSSPGWVIILVSSLLSFGGLPLAFLDPFPRPLHDSMMMFNACNLYSLDFLKHTTNVQGTCCRPMEDLPNMRTTRRELCYRGANFFVAQNSSAHLMFIVLDSNKGRHARVLNVWQSHRGRPCEFYRYKTSYFLAFQARSGHFLERHSRVGNFFSGRHCVTAPLAIQWILFLFNMSAV